MFTTLSYSTKGLHLVLSLTLGTCAVGVAVVVLCVCMYVCLSVCYCVAFAENTSFKSCGMIFLPLQPSWLLDDLLMDKRGSDGFFSTRPVYRDSDRSYNTTDLSLILTLILSLSLKASWLRKLLVFHCVSVLLTWHNAGSHV